MLLCGFCIILYNKLAHWMSKDLIIVWLDNWLIDSTESNVQVTTLYSFQVPVIVNILWDILLDLDDLDSSTKSVMALLSSLISKMSLGDRDLQSVRNLTDLFPRLWPFLKHNISAVRSSALECLKTLLNQVSDTKTGEVCPLVALSCHNEVAQRSGYLSIFRYCKRWQIKKKWILSCIESNFKCYAIDVSHGTNIRRFLEDCIGGVLRKVSDDGLLRKILCITRRIMKLWFSCVHIGILVKVESIEYNLEIRVPTSNCFAHWSFFFWDWTLIFL